MAVDDTVSHEGLRVAALVQSGHAQDRASERAPGIYECRGVGNSYLLTTIEGAVLVNTGTLADARRGRELFNAVFKEPIRHIVLTQSHANQYGGLEIYKSPETQVIAHRLHMGERHYNKSLGEYYRRGSRLFFGAITGPSEGMLPTQEIFPDVLVDERHTVTLGGRIFDIIWTPGGETRSAVIVWLPAEKIAIVGNLFGPLFGNQPNLNTLRGDKPRSALEFIQSLKTVRSLKPEMLLTGHEQVRGADHIQRELTRIADSVQWIHDRTVQGMNDGLSLRALMREVKPPSDLVLTEEYGKVSWNVRAIWHEYTGWFDPNRGTTDLYDVEQSAVAPAIAELAGGAERLAHRARAYVAEGKPLHALHLLDVACAAEPNAAAVGQAKREALQLLLSQTNGKNLWERMWIAAELRKLPG